MWIPIRIVITIKTTGNKYRVAVVANGRMIIRIADFGLSSVCRLGR